MNKNFLIGAAVAIGAVALVPGVAGALGKAARPLVRAGLRTGAVAYDEFRRAGAEAYEHAEDIFAEIREEMQAEREAARAAAAAAGPDADEAPAESHAR